MQNFVWRFSRDKTAMRERRRYTTSAYNGTWLKLLKIGFQFRHNAGSVSVGKLKQSLAFCLQRLVHNPVSLSC